MADGMSWDQAVAALTGPEGPFALIDAEIGGHKYKVFEKAPPSLRAVFDGARLRELEARITHSIDKIRAAITQRYLRSIREVREDEALDLACKRQELRDVEREAWVHLEDGNLTPPQHKMVLEVLRTEPTAPERRVSPRAN